MKNCKLIIFAMMLATLFFRTGNVAIADERWQEDTFPPPNGGRLVFTITRDGNPACASYDGRGCLWNQGIGDIDFTRVRPLVCGAEHLKLFGVTGFEDPKHWCNLALLGRTADENGAKIPTTLPTPTKPSQPAGVYRMTDWSGWNRADGVEYRFRVGWNPTNSGPGRIVDAIYHVRNPGIRRWSGAVRSLACEQDTLWGNTDVNLAPGQTKEVRVTAPNCGNERNPDIRPNVVRAGKFD